MPFAKELDIRKEGFLDDFEEAPPERLQDCLNTAHREILGETVLTDQSLVTADVVRGESLLAISHFFQSSAVALSLSQQNWKTSVLRIDSQEKINNLTATAGRLREEAWALLQAYRKTSVPPSIKVVRSEA